MAAAIVLAALVVTAATTQPPLRRYTTPRLPPREVLDRLSLTLAWSVKLPTEGTQDGLFSVQLLPANGHDELLVQTRRGLVILLDATTGDTLWRTYAGKPYELEQPAAFNADDIYVTRGDRLYVLSRKTGRQELYEVLPREETVRFGMSISASPTAGLIADSELLYLCLGTKVTAYAMPPYARLEGARPAEKPVLPRPGEKEGSPGVPWPPGMDKKTAGYGSGRGIKDQSPGGPRLRVSSFQPELAWNSLTDNVSILQPPVLAGNTVNVIGANGTLISLFSGSGKERYRFMVNGPVDAPMGQHGSIVYIGSEDHRVYAFEIGSATLLWRFMAGAPVMHQPWVTDRDVFVSAKQLGLFRVDRESGEAVWRNKRAVRFLARSQQLVYALDGVGRFLVLDYTRGTTLAEYDLSDYTLPLSNERTDRVFLGAHDGTLLCLHHRANRSPFPVRSVPKPAPKEEPKKNGKKEEPKEPPKKEEPKEPPKKEEKKEEPAGKDDLKKPAEKDDLKKPDVPKKDKDKDKAMDKDKVGLGWPAPAGPVPVLSATLLPSPRGGEGPEVRRICYAASGGVRRRLREALW
jgi:outer membrane protein assembly factor BamB